MQDRQAAHVLMRREVLCGASVIAVGTAAMAEALGYPFGSVARIGPGFLPVIYAGLLVTLGVVILAAGRGETAGIDRPALRPVIAVSAAFLAWAWLAPRAGLLVATMGLVIMAALSRPGLPRVAEIATIAIGTAAVTGVLFVCVLALPLPLWPWG